MGRWRAEWCCRLFVWVSTVSWHGRWGYRKAGQVWDDYQAGTWQAWYITLVDGHAIWTMDDTTARSWMPGNESVLVGWISITRMTYRPPRVLRNAKSIFGSTCQLATAVGICTCFEVLRSSAPSTPQAERHCGVVGGCAGGNPNFPPG
jgi:hypothetical protein